ncbi:MAG: ribosomal protein S18-alanine N-acetyltransferase [Pseudomonadota bacterium]
MNVVLKPVPTFSPMRLDDLDQVAAIEKTIYDFPWTEGNFRDSLNAGYSGWICTIHHEVVGYCVMMVAVGEAHILNISIASAWQRQGLGEALLCYLMTLARERHCDRMLLEVRPSNVAARELYEKKGFVQIGTRKGYYPALIGREDAIIFECVL